MIYAKYFPLGLAKGEAFCNREEERKRLIANIEACQHTVVISSRRYGKSSLVLYAIEETKLLYERVDLFVAVNGQMVEDQILRGVKRLINKINNKPEQIIDFIKGYIKTLKSKWVVGSDGIHIELIPDKESDPITNIMEALQMLESLLKKKATKAVFFIDEFQEIGILANGKGMEGAIRHVAQETEYLSFVFSGSNRHVLSTMFDDRNRPLYKLCDWMNLERIKEEHYVKYLNKVAKKRWGCLLDGPVLTEIFKLTERHPYYVNALCSRIWTEYEKKPPHSVEVAKAWSDYVLQEESKTAKELASLNTSQKKILIALSQGTSKDFSSKAMLQSFNLSSAMVIKSLRLLEKKDLITRHSNGSYSILDPLIKSSLILFYSAGE